MAAPTTVLEFANDTVAAYTAAKESATTALGDAQTAYAAARTGLEAATGDIADKDKEIASKRVELANADTPAEAATLGDELVTLLAERRALEADHLDARDTLADAKSDAALAAEVLERLASRLTRAHEELATATAADAEQTALETAATAPPLDTLAADATAALTATPFTDAQSRVTDAIPAKLLAAARKGFEVELAHHTRLGASERNAEDLLLAEMEEGGGVDGLVMRRTIELDRAEEDLRAWSTGAKPRFDRAILLLTSIAAETSLLTPAELAGVQALDDTPGQDAADLRVALLDARQVHFDAELDLAEVTAEKLAPDPTADVSADPDVDAAQTAFDTAETALATAQTNYDAAASDFTAWAAEVPDPAWRKVLFFIEAETSLNAIGDTDTTAVTALVDAVAQAEENLAEALDEAEQHAISIAFLEDFATLRGDRLTRSSATHPDRLLGAVRGDD